MKSTVASILLFILILIGVISLPLISYSFNVTINSQTIHMTLIPSPFPNAHPISLDWSPDGEYIAALYYSSSSSGRGFALLNATDYSVITTIQYVPPLGPAGSVQKVRWSPDGKYIAIAWAVRYGVGGFAIFEFNKTSKNLTLAWYTTLPGPRGLAWSHDGSKVALVYDSYRSNPNIQVFYSNGTLIWEKRTGIQFLYGVAWSPDDKILIVGGRENYGSSGIPGYYYGNLYLINAGNGDILWNTTLAGWVRTIAWDEETNKIFVGGHFGTIKVYDPNGTLIQESPKLGFTIDELRISPDGEYITAGVRWKQNAAYLGRLLIMDKNLNIIWEKRFSQADAYCFTWNPDANMLAYGGMSPFIYIGSKIGAIVGESNQLTTTAYSMALLNDTTALVGGDMIEAVDLNGNKIWDISLNYTSLFITTNRQTKEFVSAGVLNSTHSIIELYDGQGSRIGGIILKGNISHVSVNWKQKIIAIALMDSEVKILRIPTFNIVTDLNMTDTITGLSWSDRLPLLAISTTHSLSIYSISETGLRLLDNITSPTLILDVSFNPKIPLVTTLDYVNWITYNITYYNLTNGVLNKTGSHTLHNRALKLKWSPEGSRVALYGYNTIEVYDYEGNFLWFSATFDARNPLTTRLAGVLDLDWQSNETHIVALTQGSLWLTKIYSGPYPTPLVSSSLVGGSLVDKGSKIPISLIGLTLLLVPIYIIIINKIKQNL